MLKLVNKKLEHGHTKTVRVHTRIRSHICKDREPLGALMLERSSELTAPPFRPRVVYVFTCSFGECSFSGSLDESSLYSKLEL
jgi:hypothetical protein